MLYNGLVFGGICIRGRKRNLRPFRANMEVMPDMVIHLGANKALGAEQILLCTDITRGWTADTENLVRGMREKHLVRRLSDAPKTLVLCREGGRVVCYLTGVGLRTLSARMREDRGFFLRLMDRERQETGQSEVQHVERIGSGA